MLKAAAMVHPTSAWPDGRSRLGHGDRENEDEQCGRRRRRRLRRRDAREEHGEADHGHRSDRERLVRRDDRAEHDEATPDDIEAYVGDDAGPGATRELDQQEQGERTEGREEAHLRVREGDMGDGEGRGHHHGGPNRALDHEKFRVLGPEPLAEAGPSAARSGYRRSGGLGHRPLSSSPRPEVPASGPASGWLARSGHRSVPKRPTWRAEAWSARPPCSTRSEPAMRRPPISATVAYVAGRGEELHVRGVGARRRHPLRVSTRPAAGGTGSRHTVTPVRRGAPGNAGRRSGAWPGSRPSGRAWH